ncbi:hypothetical protein [Naasia sp. SYSU D00948]|uniref:hypothetical protein n=1 Tax=Naasia sp. SYSU D00948 TaxID=2817379 RepID=UPI001FEE0240|nr:hypothetical protein [Naasia sp. SYSU D00948]
MLDKGARSELRTLSKENADWVAGHLVMASRLLDEDPELAHRHALSAARKGGRIAVVRETLAITAYTVGDFALALRELRTFRRISGSNDQLPLMVDSERGVGRPDRALELGRSVPRETLSAPVQVALAIAMSGARLDLGQPELALGELEIPQLNPDRAFSYSPPLYRAYAEVLDELGRVDEAEQWRARAAVAEEALEPEEDVVEIEDLSIEDAADDQATDGAKADGAGLDEGMSDPQIDAGSPDAEVDAGGHDTGVGVSSPDAEDGSGAADDAGSAAETADSEPSEAAGASAERVESADVAHSSTGAVTDAALTAEDSADVEDAAGAVTAAAATDAAAVTDADSATDENEDDTDVAEGR